MTSLNAQPEGLEIPVDLLDASPELRARVRDLAWMVVVDGVSDPGSFPRLLKDWHELDITDDQAEAVGAYVIEQRRAQQATFGENPQTKLDRAFAALREARIVAEQDFTCCGTCGDAEIGADLADDIEQWLGYVFYHHQDLESLMEYGSVHINFGIFWPAYVTEAEFEAMPTRERERTYEAKSIDLMNAVVIPILRAHDIGVKWNGKFSQRPELTGVECYCPI